MNRAGGRDAAFLGLGNGAAFRCRCLRVGRGDDAGRGGVEGAHGARARRQRCRARLNVEGEFRSA